MQHLDPYYQQTSSYIQLFETIVELRMPYASLVEAFRRMVFNVLARNQDDHTKNHAFRLKQGGAWELAPAYDLTFVLSPGMKQQMWIGQKLTGITRSDCLKEAERFSIAGKSVIREVGDAIRRWPEFAKLAGLPSEATATIHRELLAANAGF
jgi:serine/threonine-protein kinase HipA